MHSSTWADQPYRLCRLHSMHKRQKVPLEIFPFRLQGMKPMERRYLKLKELMVPLPLQCMKTWYGCTQKKIQREQKVDLLWEATTNQRQRRMNTCESHLT